MKRVRERYREHTNNRTVERYGICMTRQRRNKILRRIRQGRTTRQKSLTNSRTLHEVCVDDIMFFVIYSKTTKEIVTVIDRKYAEKLFNV